MGRKIKSIVLLILVLILIYCQQTPLIYAGEVTEQGESIDTGESTDIGEITDSGDGTEEKDEEVQIEKYQLEYQQSDGKEGYYVTVPEIKLSHKSAKGTTIYELIGNGERIAEGRLRKIDVNGEEEVTVVLGAEQIREGINILNIYMEDDEGKRVEEYDCAVEFKVDTEPPALHISAPEGFDTWYQKEAWIEVKAEDNEWGSEVASIACYCGNQIVGIVKNEDAKNVDASAQRVENGRAEFLIQQTSESGNGVPVTVTVTDKAGNKREATRKLYIDSSAPVVNIEGVMDYMITSQPVTVTYKAVEDNVWKECRAQTEYEDTEGAKQILPAGEWKQIGREKSLVQTFSEDGIYRMKAMAEDAAGYRGEKEAQVIIDSQNPIIQYVDQLDGKFMKKFCWNYPTETFIKDFTTFVYQMQMDGRMYPVGAQVTSEGHHILKVEAVDAAGNRASAEAGFVIDHTAPGIEFVDVEEGGRYEEKRTFQIVSANQEDKLKEVRINGIAQSLKKENGRYEYTVREIGDYEVEVCAEDRAGNQGRASVMFEVVPKPTVWQQAVKPIRKVFVGGDKSPGKSEKVDKGYAEIRWIVEGILLICAVTGCVTGVVWYKKKQEEKKETGE